MGAPGQSGYAGSKGETVMFKLLLLIMLSLCNVTPFMTAIDLR